MKRTMNRESRGRKSWLAAVLIGGLAVCWLGCGSGDAPPEDDQPAAGAEEGASGEGASGEAPATGPEGVAPGAATRTPGAGGPVPAGITGREILEEMAAAYREADSYGDTGTVRLQAAMGDQKMDESVDYLVAYDEPNKLRMNVYTGQLVSDGQKMYGAVLDLPGQVVVKDAPQALTPRNIYTDRVLASALTQGFAGPAPQILLLLADDALKALLFDSGEPELVGTGKVGEEDCYRVAVERPDGRAVFWVDQDTHELRRMEFPTKDMERAIGRGAKLDSISLVADFNDAKLGREFGPEAFAFQTPPAAQVVEFLVPPNPGQLLAKQVPAFRFTTPSGKQVTPAAYEGKVLVLDFWATWCGPCRMSLPNLEKVRQQYQENDNVAFLAVSVDQPDTPDAKLRSTFDELKVDIPMARDIEQQSGNLFKFNSIPIMFIVGPKGLVQYFETGGNPQLAAILPEKIDKLLAGEDIYEEPLEQYEKQLEQFANPEAAMQQESEIPQADVAPKSEPEKLALAPLWQAEGLSGPGNIVVVPDKSGAARLLVVSDWKSVAEIGPDGKVVATYPLQLPEQEVVSFLRTATTPDGKRIFAGSAPGMLQLYAFDEKFNPLFVYPEAAMENPHSGITDVQIADLDGDGTPMLAVGYRGDVGVQGVSIEGERIWSNRSVPIVLRLAVGAPNAEGKRTLLCANGSEGLAALNAEGKTQGEINVPGRMLYWIAAEDLNGDGKAEYCALSATNLGKMSALGIDLEGNELWSYDLPEGVHTQPIEPVTAGQLSADGPGVWILAAADGSLHFLGADGSVLDRFNYGKELSGVATATIQGQAALLVSTPEQLEAWKIQSAP